jgi:hypothetical protein
MPALAPDAISVILDSLPSACGEALSPLRPGAPQTHREGTAGLADLHSLGVSAEPRINLM